MIGVETIASITTVRPAWSSRTLHEDSLRYNVGLWRSLMSDFDSFTIAVLVSGISVIVVFGLMIVLDKGKRVAPPASAATKVAGKR
jgi:hypothetical protein